MPINGWIAAVLIVFGSAATAAAADRPNIVFLLTDDQTVAAAGCYGNPEILTPHLDQLASEGVRFTNYYNTTSICMASRASLFTGLYEYRHGCNFDHGNLARPLVERSYPVLLRQAGYYTGFAGKIGFEIAGEPFAAFASLFDQWAGGPGQTFYETARNPGIARYASEYPHCSRAYGAWAVDFFRLAAQSGKPFCLSISFKAPHLPFTPDPLDLGRYEGKTFTRPANYGVNHGRHLAPQSHTSRAATGYREWVNDYDATTARYYALITGVDAALGMIRDGLAREALADNTVIIFTSDNGYHCGAHGFGDKVLPYEEGSKSPLVIYDPRASKRATAAVCDAVAGNVDVTATLFAIAGVTPPEELDGTSLLPLLGDPAGTVREFLPLFNFWGVPTAQSMAVVTPEWKYIYWFHGGAAMQPTEELFDLAADRGEMVNLAANPKHTAQLARMRQFYDAQLEHLTPRVIDTNGYQPYPTLFDRAAKWETKAALLPAQQRSVGAGNRGR